MLAVLLVAGPATDASAADMGPGSVWRESFDSLRAWHALTFPKIERHTRYSVTKLDGRPVLRAEADASASALVCAKSFNPYRTPVLRWRWRVENVYRKGDVDRKEGDDCPIRVYALFAYDPDRASLGMRVKYALATRLYGRTPPHASLNYIWASRPHDERILVNAYTGRSRMVVLQTGVSRTRRWIEEEVNLLADYRAAFKEDPPRVATLAIMSDADNTGESTTAFIDFVELRVRPTEKVLRE